MRIEYSTGVANIEDCIEQSCELVEAYYCSDITVALIVLNLVELKTLVLILWVSTRCVYLYGHRGLVHTPVILPVVL